MQQHPHVPPEGRSHPKGISRFPYPLLLAALLVATLALRLVALGAFPSNLMADEADNLVVIYKILYGCGPDLFGLDWKPNPVLSLYAAAPFVAAFGESALGLRLLSALTSTVALVPLYALYRRRLSAPACLLSLALLATSVWYLNFSRSGWENVHIVLLTATACWLLTCALETGQWRYYALSGVTAALGLYGYFAGRAILVALLVYAPFALRQHRDRWKVVLMGYVLLGLAAVSFFLPQLPAIRRNPDLFNIRAERVSVIRAAATTDGYFDRHGPAEVLPYQVWRNARFFFDGAVLAGDAYSPPEQLLQDTRPRYSPFGRALLDPMTAVLFAAGLLLSFWRREDVALWWVMLLTPWLLTQVLTINTPDAARGIGMLPAIYFFVGLALDQAWRILPRRSLMRQGLVAVVALTAMLTTASYFTWAADPQTLAAREPAVPLEHFDEWRSLQIERARANQPLLPVSIWQQLQMEE